MRANPDKTQVTEFHLRNREAKRSLKVSWNGVDLENTTHPKDVELQTSHTEYRKKIANSKWGTNASTIRTTALALCYSI